MKMLKTCKVITLLLFVWLTNSKAAHFSAEENVYKRIVDIVNSSPNPKGIPFPNHIPSPKCLNDRIVIVGAGPAGIHMAYLLKKKGFNNIVVLEKSHRIGGKSYTVNHRNVPHEMGTCYSQPDYKDNIIALAKEFGLWQPVNLPSANIWLDKYRAPISYKVYVIKEVMAILGTQNQSLAKVALFSAMIKYALLHRQLFGKYDGELMWKPAPATMNILRCTFYEFLQKYNLTVLKPIFIASHTVQGYGHLDEVSALYGLMWNTPNYLKGLSKKFLGKEQHLLNMIRGGYQRLWETIKSWSDIKVMFNVDITKLVRRDTKVKVKISHKGWLKFDFLIWTPSLYSNLHLINPCKKEKEIFSKLNPAWFTTTLFDSTYGIRGPSPIDYWISNIENKREHSVWAQRDSYSTLNQLGGPAYENGSLPGGPDGKFVRTGVLYQYGKMIPTDAEIEKNAYVQLQKIHADRISVLQQKTWEYFPRFSPQEMARGILWDIFDLQGNRNTWFAGSSVSFESVKSVLEYNRLLVSKITTVDYCREHN